MTKVITYGTYDLLHYGHIKLLERARKLGDYLIVGITADDFDLSRGKIDVQQSLLERIEAVRATGLADEIIIEEYEGQKIDDIKRLGVDIFTVGSDWKGKFDYLNEFCKVEYLDRTEGVSSSNLRSESRQLALGIIGEPESIDKFIRESKYVNGIVLRAIFRESEHTVNMKEGAFPRVIDRYEDLLDIVDAVYIASHPSKRYEMVKKAIQKHKHVLCEAPIALSLSECDELIALAKENNVVLFDGIKTAYSTAFSRMILLAKSGKIGDIVSVDAVCTSLKNFDISKSDILAKSWGSLADWGPIALLPVFLLLGTDYIKKSIVSLLPYDNYDFDSFSKVSFIYHSAVASVKVAVGVKSEGELIISGTKGYIFVPSPWWKTDYFEIRYEDQNQNGRYFYHLEGEGIRLEISSFVKIVNQLGGSAIPINVTKAISALMGDYCSRKDTVIIGR